MSTKIVCHRATLDKNLFEENNLESLEQCIRSGFAVEIDVHVKDDAVFLGHDSAEQKIELCSIDKQNVFIHIKNGGLLNCKSADTFYLNEDSVAYTGKGRRWLNVGSKVQAPSDILCSDELIGDEFSERRIIEALKIGSYVCTKYPFRVLDLYKNLGVA